MAGEKILVVDDEKLIADLCRRILVKKGYEVRTAYTGTQALEICENAPFDILLTDIKMPGMDGLELIEKARKYQPDIAAMVITAYGTINTAIDTLKLGAMSFIVKPFQPGTLLAAVEDVIERRQTIREIARLKFLMPLFETTKTLMSEVDLNRLLNLIVNYAVKETKAEEGSLWILDGTGELKSCVETDFAINMTGILENRIGERVARWTMELRRPLLLNRNSQNRNLPDGQCQTVRVDGDLSAIFENNDLLSILSVPLMKKEQMIGILNLCKLTDRTPFSEADQEIATILCGQAAIAVENARLFQNLKAANLDTIKALGSALEAKDLATKGHSDRTVEMALAVARRLGLSQQEEEWAQYTAILHDIGKIGIPESILNKPADLTHDDFEVMRRHPLLGCEMISQIEFLRPIVPFIRADHERWDGKGYPDGLAGEAIPLIARIVAVVDAYDAMTSDRIYRKAPGREYAIQELQRCAGTQFDPTVVKTFLKILKDKLI
ncbi:MAG: response regulator [Nitrospira sp.]|nr:response regulator [Nitrospira sp.]